VQALLSNSQNTDALSTLFWSALKHSTIGALAKKINLIPAKTSPPASQHSSNSLPPATLKCSNMLFFKKKNSTKVISSEKPALL